MVDPVLAPESDGIRMWLDVYGPSFPIGSLEGRVPASGVSWSGGVSVSQPWRVKRVRLSREEGLGARDRVVLLEPADLGLQLLISASSSLVAPAVGGQRRQPVVLVHSDD